MTFQLSEELAYGFVGALLSVARVDGAVTHAESKALREIAGEVTADDFDFEQALMTTVSVESFATMLKKQGEGPFRKDGTTDVQNIARVFVAAARRVASAEDGSSGNEDRLIRAFLDKLGV